MLLPSRYFPKGQSRQNIYTYIINGKGWPVSSLILFQEIIEYLLTTNGSWRLYFFGGQQSTLLLEAFSGGCEELRVEW